MPNKLLTASKLGDAFVYVCTIQRMGINLSAVMGRCKLATTFCHLS